MIVALKMRLKFWIALGAIFFASVSLADDEPHFECLDCRNIVEHPKDARNFAINRLFGRESSLAFDDTRFTLSDRFGNTITVDINAKFILNPYDYQLFDELFVEDIVIQILLVYPNGDVRSYKHARNLLDPNGVLPVPAEMAPSPQPDSEPGPDSGGAAPGDDPRDDWDFQDEYWADWEEAWGGWHCRPDYSRSWVTGVICRQG